ncbi:hypothetical protein [Cellulomonas composti]|uniref:hypothetical protein n=1 Tax=Cellulomonas composti TaxID=266130 RepID=UPI0011BFC9F2|nr:hypothetical protein [Cellulomonas composti]
MPPASRALAPSSRAVSRAITRASRRAVQALLALVAALGLVVLGAGTAQADDGDEQHDIVLVGVGGLHWSDVDRLGTPMLWQMVEQGSVGSVSVRTVSAPTCPLDAWLTISAGRRVLPAGTDTTSEPDAESDDPSGCAALPAVTGDDDGPLPAPHVVAGWGGLVDPADPDAPPGSYGTPGTVGTRVAAVGACSTALGPGAGIALADENGALTRYAPTLGAVTDTQVAVCPVTVLDGGDLPADRVERREALALLDDQLNRLVDVVEDGTDVVVAGIADGTAGEAGLQAVVQWRAGGGPIGWLTSESTRRPGIVTLTDLSASLVAAAGGDTGDLDGSPVEVGSERRMSTERTVENRRYLTEMTTIAPHLMPLVLTVVATTVAAALGAVALRRRRREQPPAALRRVSVAVLLLGACTPVGAHLAALSRWWGAPAPLFSATAWWGVATTAAALVAWLVSRLLPRGPWRLACATAAVTWAVVTVDGLTGTVLQQGSILGSTTTLGARYYGFGNMTFGVYAACALVLAAALGVGLAHRGRPRLGLVAVLAVGVVTVVVDGWPAFGADFGGVLALVPAFAVLFVGLAGRPLTALRGLGVIALAVAVVVVVAVVDWARPGRPTHLGLFVQRVVDGDLVGVLAGKAAGAWATVALPLGAAAAVVCIGICVLLVGPQRWRPPVLRRLYRQWTGLRPLVLSTVVVAVLGSVLNDSGVVVAVAVLATAGVILLAGATDHAWRHLPDDPAPERAPVHRMPVVVLAAGAGVLAAVLVATVVVPLPAAVAGDVTSGAGESAAPVEAPVVLVGTSGVDWSKLDRTLTPALWGLLRDGAPAAGVTPGVTGRSSRCDSAGWLALSSGRNALAGRNVDGEWSCLPWDVAATGEGAAVTGWSDLVALQSSSEFHPRLGALGETLATVPGCSTAVGPRAAIALAGTDGTVARYRTVDEALADPADAFACGTTVVDAGSAVVPVAEPDEPSEGTPTPTPTPSLDPEVAAAQREAEREAARVAAEQALRALDVTVGRIVRAAPAGSTVLVVDTGRASVGLPVLGVGIGDADAGGTRYLTTPATRWVGVFRLLDVPVTLLVHAGADVPDDFAGSPVVAGESRPTDVTTAVAQLADLSSRDQVLRGSSAPVTSTPLLLALLLVVGAALLGPRLARRRPALAERLRRVADVVLLVLAALPAALFLLTTTWWWRLGDGRTPMWIALTGVTAALVGVVALVPRRPLTTGPGVLAGITFGLLTLDAVLGTPLHRGSPLGPAVTLGGRFYGFGNPTYSVYVVAAFVTAAVLGGWLRARGRRLWGAAAAAVVCGVALVVDLWPSLGADVGGGLVLVPAGLVVVLGVAGVRVTWQRLVLAGAAGVLVVGVIGVLDWMRPPAQRTHLGVFVQRLVDGTAWETVWRKLGYATESLGGGWIAWVTLVVLVLVIVVLWPGSRLQPDAWVRLEAAWPLARTVLVALLVAGIAGGLVNDYGVRVATLMLVAAVPLFGMLGLRARTAHYPASTPAPADPPANAQDGS